MTDWPNVEDMPFNHNNSVVTDDQADLIIEYCINDVSSTEHLVKMNFKEIDLRVNLSDKYGIDFMNASNSKIGSELLLHLYCKKTNKNPSVVRTMRTERSSINCRDLIFPYIRFDSEPFQSVLNVFNELIIRSSIDFSHSLLINGFKLDYGLGGIHGSLENSIIEATDDEIILDIDVNGFYPSMAVQNKMYPQHLGIEFAEVYGEEIVSVRMREKSKGKEGDQIIVAGYKEAGNASFGKSNDAYSWLFDRAYCYQTTINGQLLLSMLIEKLLLVPQLQIIQANTKPLVF